MSSPLNSTQINRPTQQSSRRSTRRIIGMFLYLLLFYTLLVGSLATFFAKQHWIAEIACHLRVQISIGFIICGLIAIAQKNKLRFLAASIFLLVHAAWIAPYFLTATAAWTPPTDRSTDSGSNHANAEGSSIETTDRLTTFKIMSANLLVDNHQHAAFIDTVSRHAPDIIVVLEVTPRWHQALAEVLSDDYPYQNIVSKDHAFGIGILSKTPLTEVIPIVAPDTELISLDARLTGPTGRPLRLIATHPFPPLSQHCFASRSRQLIGLAEKIDPARDNIIAGDFNLTPWSPIFSEMLETGGLTDSRLGFGLATTWYAFPSFLTGIQIDHVLTSQSLAVVDHQISEYYGSDHRAVIVEIRPKETSMSSATKKLSQQNHLSPIDLPPTDSENRSIPTIADAPSPQRTSEARLSIVYSKDYLIDLGGLEKMHSFDIRKYEKIHDALINERLITAQQFLAPDELVDQDLKLIHTDDYLKRLGNRSNIANYLEADLLKLYPGSLDNAVLRPFRVASGGTLLAAREAINCGIGVNIGGGYHHAKPDIGEGFCLYADVPIAIRRLQQEGRIERALVIDVDVHQGNGTAECLADDDSTFTFSMHQSDIYPIPKSNSDRDVGLQSGDGDQRFMEVLENHLDDVIEEAGADICFIVGGCDTLAGDPLAGLMMTEAGICQRDAVIIDRCVANGIPVVLTLSGGYSKNAWRSQYLSIKGLIDKYGLSDDG